MAKAKPNKDFKIIYEMYTQARTTHDQYKPLWDDIAKFCGITVRTDYMWTNNQGSKSQDLDQFVDDPTAALSVNQFGDYLLGIMWGTGDKVFDLVPSRYVLELTDQANVDKHYAYATEQALYHMNQSSAGLQTAFRPYVYDQGSFGTSGIGAFPNKAFVNGVEENAIIFRNYGIDNMAIDEGKSGLVDVTFVPYYWSCRRIVDEFCTDNGKVDEKALAKLPKPIQNAYKKNQYNEQFTIIFGMLPRDNFDPKLAGKRGARWRGVWFMDSGPDNDIFHEESYKEKPIAVCRQIKVRNEVYGRSSGTLLLSSIRLNNFIVGATAEIMEKMNNPSLGVFNSSIFGDSVLDDSAGGLTVFNEAMAGSAKTPVFPLYTVGNPAPIIEFLIPYLNEKIATAFKIDALLDFSTAKEMTATESLQRYAIRGKSLAGLLQQQKIECLEPLVKRCVSILEGMGELGTDPTTNTKRADKLREIGKPERIIPDAVAQVKKEGKPWFDIKFNNELEKLTRTEAVQNLLQILQAIGAIASLYPQIIEGINWHKLLSDINDNLDYNSQILVSEKDFKKIVAAIAQRQQASLALQAGEGASNIQKNAAQANKANNEALNVRQSAGQS